MLLVRHIPYYYLRSFQKIASHESYDEMLLTTNKRWNNFITLSPAAREDALLVSLPSPQCAGIFTVAAIGIVALVARRRAGVVARVVIIVVVVALSGVVNVVVCRNHHRCRRR